MRFTRKSDTKFFLPEGGSPDGICLYASFTANSVDLGGQLADATAYFLVIFFKAGTVIGNANLESKLTDVTGLRERRIYWLDEFTSAAVDRAPVLAFNARNEAPSLVNINLGAESSDFFVEIGSRATRGRVTFANDTFGVETTNGKMIFTAHSPDAGRRNSNAVFSRLSIPATGATQGSLNFTTEGTTARLIQPAAPYIGLDNENYAVEFFDRISFDRNVDLSVTYFPYRLSTNDRHLYSSFIKFVPKVRGQVKFQLPSEKGLNFMVEEFAGDFQASLVRVEYVDSDIKPKYFFIPEGKLRLSGVGAEKLLVGYSGTETLPAQSEINFLRSKKLKVRVDSKGTSLVESSGSVTSFINLATDQVLFLDAQKSPAFGNPGPKTVVRKKPAKGRAQEVVAVETPYEPIPQKLIKGPVPMVPIFSLKHDPRLVELEKVFSILRKEWSSPLPVRRRLLTQGNYVTPQGFLRSGNTLNLIATSAQKGRSQRAGSHNYSFEVGPIDTDFNVAITKEEVFFVTTPKLLRDAGSPAMIRAFFAMGDFEVDLLPLAENVYTPADSEKIIIFKFSRSSFQDLLRDTSRWSNWGRYSDKNPKIHLSDLSKSIDEYIEDFPDTDDYLYFNQTVKTNSDWNGVVILNVPITDEGQLPDLFTGLAASQKLQPNESSADKVPLKTAMKFQYVAFPVNKTETQNTGAISIKSTSFYGLIDYDVLKDRGEKDSDYEKVSKHFPDLSDDDTRTEAPWRFLLTKLLIRFENSNVANFAAFAFLRVPRLFEEGLTMRNIRLTHRNPNPDSDTGADEKQNLIRLEGRYQKNDNGDGEFTVAAGTNILCDFPNNPILKGIEVTKVSFSYVNGEKETYRFDLNARAFFSPDVGLVSQLINFKSLEFQGIGLKFPRVKGTLPKIDFDISRLFVLPEIEFDGKGFLRSFPIRLNRLQTFKLGSFDISPFDDQNFDFLPIFNFKGGVKPLAILWGLIFDFDLGTLGDLELLKSLKGEILLGWTAGGGFKLGLRLAPRANSLHIDLFGALKLDIDQVALCSFKTAAGDTSYFLKLVNARLTVMGVELPRKDQFDFNAIVYAKPGSAVAWFIAATKKGVAGKPGPLLLGVGQRVGLQKSVNARFTKVEECIGKIKEVFAIEKDPCAANASPARFYEPESNWLVASDSILPADLSKILSLEFVFNDPVLYGIHLGLKSGVAAGFAIDIIYKKLSDNLGVWSLEIQLPNAIRNIEMGAASVTLPNLGVEIYTDGGWRIDVGFPKGEDYSRSCLVQVRPFVGWGGIYLLKTETASLTLFRDVIPDEYSRRQLTVMQAGFALRLGLGAYIDKGIFFAGASISLYSILEGAFAFEKGETGGLKQLFPNHFALQGRFGAIAEIVGYVDFTIVKAAIYIVLRQEVGVLLIYLDREVKGPDDKVRKGLQPVNLYIEASVTVRVEVTIACFRIFRRKFCIKVSFSFSATVRFQYTLGGSTSASRNFLETTLRLPSIAEDVEHNIPVMNVKEIPVTYIPGFTKTGEAAGAPLRLVHHFAIPFFAKTVDKEVVFTKNNIMRQLVENIFTGLIAGLPPAVKPTYENLRSILLTGKISAGAQSYNINITFPAYRPWFITGHSLTNPADDVFDKFGFNRTEATAFVDELKAGRNPFRLIPTPISTKIFVSDGRLGQTPREVLDGFKIEVTNIVKRGEELTISHTIKELDFTRPEVEKFKTFFNNYKTQFIDRRRARFSRKELDETQPLRQTFVISEYFKLVALLTLESYYNFGTEKDRESNDRMKEDAPFNPLIDAREISSNEVGSSWKLNEHLDRIVGQLNYFYNSGLRLPDVKSASKEPPTKAYFELLEQSSDYTAVSDQPVDKALVILKDGTANGVDLTKDMFLRQVFRKSESDDYDTESFAEFKTGITDSINVDLTSLSKSFAAAEMRPFELLPITLAVQSGGLRSNPAPDGSPLRFYALPEKLQTGVGEHRISLIWSERKDVEKSKKENVTRRALPCAIVEMKVRPHEKTKKGEAKLLEIVNVDIDNVTLMNFLRGLPAGRVRNVRLYLRKPTELSPLSSPHTTIVKTNLSTETHPPLIGRKMPPTAPLDFIAESSDVVNFTRLVWEGVTTNNSGYFFLLDKEYAFPDPPAPEPPVTEYTVALTFEFEEAPGDVGVAFPTFCNYLKITDAKPGATPPPIFDGLDVNSHYLYLEVFTTRNEAGLPVQLKEYHAKMPAHCFGFELNRPKTVARSDGAAYSQYLPLEFDLKKRGAAQPVLNKNRVLPLMPVDDDRKGADPNRLVYRHVTPLRTEDSQRPDPHNLGRYSVVGENYHLTFGLRDTFGFRAADLKTANGAAQLVLEYRHPYFDKLVPLDSWPLLKFSYWFESYDEGTKDFAWKLTCAVDAEGLPTLLGLREKAAKRAVVDDAAMVEAAGSLESILNNLYTIQAQLTDTHAQVRIPGFTPAKDVKTFLRAQVDRAVTLVEQFAANRQLPARLPATDSLSLKRKYSEFKTPLAVRIEIERDGYWVGQSHASLLTAEVLEYTNVKSISCDIKLEKPKSARRRADEETPQPVYTVNDLEGEIAVKTRGVYCLGISSDASRAKVIYLVSRETLKKVALKEVPVVNRNYYGIRPYSNFLWSGTYAPEAVSSRAAGGAVTHFSNVDLDTALRVVLSKVDELLTPASVLENAKDTRLMDELIGAKKALAKHLSELVANVAPHGVPEPSKFLKKRFRNVLLERLSNFYDYDGILGSGVDVRDATLRAVLESHRLTITFESHNDPPVRVEKKNEYNVVSTKVSKIKDDNDDAEWGILFDRLPEGGDISLNIIPQITHLEFGIDPVKNTDIESSTWIQLVRPVGLAAVSTDRWPKIVRRFPPKPVIKGQTVKQTAEDKGELRWVPSTLGAWEYEIVIEDVNDSDQRLGYVAGDELEVGLHTVTALRPRMLANDSPEGFIAYWADKITAEQGANFKWDEFARDLSARFNKSGTLRKNEELEEPEITVAYKKNDARSWSRVRFKGLPATSFPARLLVSDNKLAIPINRLNILTETRIISVKPDLKVFRNKAVSNPVFHYHTETVSPPTWATPQIRFYSEIKTTGTLQSVLGDVPDKLPYKATAKLLLDVGDLKAIGQTHDPARPFVPVRQMEFAAGERPVPAVDNHLPSIYQNGWPAVSVTIYNKKGSESDLPIFHAELVTKDVRPQRRNGAHATHGGKKTRGRKRPAKKNAARKRTAE